MEVECGWKGKEGHLRTTMVDDCKLLMIEEATSENAVWENGLLRFAKSSFKIINDRKYSTPSQARSNYKRISAIE